VGEGERERSHHVYLHAANDDASVAIRTGLEK
jgi:hypothetical protein